jgi:hypothetical protein
MSELVYPHSIDAGTAITANEVQGNFDEVADVVNGQLQGGSGSDGNLAANGVTARELADLILTSGLPPLGSREGLASQPVANVTGFYVSPGAGLVLNYAGGTAWVRDDSGVLAATALIPVVVTGSTVTVTANSSGNPRIDQVILTMTGYGTGTVSVLPGTATAGATLDNRTGAAALPSDAIRIADILMANGFAGPFVDHTSIRNRLAWAVPMEFNPSAATSFEFVIDSTVDEIVEMKFAGEASGLGHLALFPENLTTSIYSYAEQGAFTTSAPTTGNDQRGSYAGTQGMYIAFVGTGVSAGGQRYAGRHIFYPRNMSSVRLSVGEAVASSLIGSGNQVLNTNHHGNYMGSSAVLSYIKVGVSTGTFTGRFIIDRIPGV